MVYLVCLFYPAVFKLSCAARIAVQDGPVQIRPAEGPHLEITSQNNRFEIFYQKAEASDGSVLLSLPSSLPFQVSGTNTDGCIVTLWR